MHGAWTRMTMPDDFGIITIWKERNFILDGKRIFLCVIFIVILAVGIVIYVRHLHHKKAKGRVRERGDARKLQEINEALRPFGFSYDAENDIFYSLRDAWQRKMGYGKLYDEMAPAMNMVIDCEPIYFTYGGRRWLIELWKGQYGVTTGAEVGIYVEENRGDEKEAGDVFYQAVSEDEEMRLSMALYKDGERVFYREDRHWWLTGFRLGEFSEPAELMLRASILFPNQNMKGAFLAGCYQAGYRPEDVYVRFNGVVINFAQPKTAQPTFFGKWHCKFIQWQNRWNCKLYWHLTKSFDRTLDKLDYLMMEYPAVFHLVTGLGRAGRISDKRERKERGPEWAEEDWTGYGRGGRRR